MTQLPFQTFPQQPQINQQPPFLQQFQNSQQPQINQQPPFLQQFQNPQQPQINQQPPFLQQFPQKSQMKQSEKYFLLGPAKEVEKIKQDKMTDLNYNKSLSNPLIRQSLTEQIKYVITQIQKKNKYGSLFLPKKISGNSI
jgi:hypothetical protein